MAKVKQEEMKRAVIAGAATALKYKQENPIETEEQILRRVIGDVRKIIDNIEEVSNE